MFETINNYIRKNKYLFSLAKTVKNHLIFCNEAIKNLKKGGYKSFTIKIPCILEQPNIAQTGLITPCGHRFEKLFLTVKKNTIIGVNNDQTFLLKIEIAPHKRKANSLKKEAEIISYLNNKNCYSCPKLIKTGKIKSSLVMNTLLASTIISENINDELDYMIQEYIPSSSKANLADMLFSIIEMKNLGIYHNDIKPSNLRFNDQKAICYLVDYDQAIKLDEKTSSLNAFDFIKWSETASKNEHNNYSWLIRFNNLTINNIKYLFRNGAFNIAATTIFKRQATTNTPNGVYHTLNFKDIYAEGVRDIEDRRAVLDNISFKEDETVLDIGANSGLLCHYLHDIGCKATGFELDEYIVTAANMIANITNKNITFECFDLDKGEFKQQYDTIMLFSVLHHTQNVKANSLKIANACNRIIIECRLVEDGKKPINGKWEETSIWQYEKEKDLIQGLENLFIGFKLAKNYGLGGKARYILEFTK